MAKASGRVLVVDDDPAILKLCAEVLQRDGHQVETAENGRAALELIREGEFDVILSDILMPELDGLQLLRGVRERDLDVPVILMTGNPNTETAIQAIDHGVLRYLVKPMSIGTLSEAVTQAVRLRSMAALKREALTHLGTGDKLVGDAAGLQVAFQRALDSLRIVYQPVVSASDGSLYGYEAFVRTEAAALPNPGALFHAAERLGTIEVLGRAIRGSIAASMPRLAAKTVFVNLHPLELTDDDLFSPEAPLSAKAPAIVLEINERASLKDVSDLQLRIRDLRALGFRMALDDLGAGYAGLTDFATFQPELVKLDMSLVRGVESDPIKRKLVEHIVELCKDLELEVVAKGVETEGERRALEALGCVLLQGYLFGPPAAPPPRGPAAV